MKTPRGRAGGASGGGGGRGVAVLILGGGIMQLPAVRASRAMGWDVSVAALRIDTGVRELADRCLEVDVSDARAVEKAARRLADESGLDGVFTAGTDFSATVAWVAERLGLPGIPYSAAVAATDKARMRRCLQAAGVPSPAFAVLVAGEKLQRPPDLCFPLVVKPVDNMGARGVRRVDSDAELSVAVPVAWEQSRSRRAIVEEYLEGPELSLDALIHGGRITVCGVADRHIAFPPHFVEMGHTMPSGEDAASVRNAEEVFAQGIRALGLVLGAAKGDIKLTARGAVVGEIAARLSGGYMSGWTFPLASGVPVTRAALRLAVGLPPEDLTARSSRVSAERAFISIPGKIRAIEGLDAAGAVPGVEEVFLRVHAGQEVDLPINNMGKCGNVISVGASRPEAVGAAERAARCVLVRLEPGETRTDGFLAEPVAQGCAAFSRVSRELLQAVARLPEGARGPQDPRRPVRIQVPQGLDRDPSRDWHGGSLREALEVVCAATGARAGDGLERNVHNLGAAFWRGLLKGGAQAGVYLVDSLIAGFGVPRTSGRGIEGSS